MQCFLKAKQLEDQFRTVEVKHIPREENAQTNILSKLASGKENGQLSSIVKQVLMKPTIECLAMTNTTGRPNWRKEVIHLIKEQEEGKSHQIRDAKRIAKMKRNMC